MPPPIRMLLIFDFDGTLAGIVPEKGEARLHSENRKLLRELSAIPGVVTAVLSSRSLDDIVSRIDVPGIYVGGASGLEWSVPGMGRVTAPQEIRDEVNFARAQTIDLIRSLEATQGIIVEDKFWSVAVHTRGAPEESRRFVERFLLESSPVRQLNRFRGPEVIEIAMVPGMDKSAGVRRLCALAGIDPRRTAIIYAGDDENDAQAMEWVLGRGGSAISVGDRPLAAGSLVVNGPGLLAAAVRKLLSRLPKSAESR